MPWKNDSSSNGSFSPRLVRQQEQMIFMENPPPTAKSGRPSRVWKISHGVKRKASLRHVNALMNFYHLVFTETSNGV
jgi:hypothetical protein